MSAYHSEEHTRGVLDTSSMLARNNAVSLTLVLKKTNPQQEIFLPVCALVHFSVSGAYSFIYDLHLVLKYCMGRQSILLHHLSWILSFLAIMYYICPCIFLLKLSFT